MDLTAEEERILAGEAGETRRQMLEILVALGKVFGADHLVPIRSAQVSGASFKTIGRYGLEWLRHLDARVAVPTILNPVGLDRERWREMGISTEFAQKQEEVIAAYRKLGISLECTCTPYYLTQTGYGNHLAWSESSAVAYVNSVIGARTNREGGPGALAAAIIGKTPFYGLHLTDQRKPSVVVEPAPDLPVSGIADYGAFGYAAGKLVGNRIPLFRGIRPTRDQMKALGAAMAASGAVALFHVDRITPDARVFLYDIGGLDVLTIGRDEVEPLFAEKKVDAVAIGCPHCSAAELSEIQALLSGKIVSIPLYIFASRAVIRENPGEVAAIERSGARVFADTCMVVSPALEGIGTIMVNSGKAYAYVPDMCGAIVRMGSTQECVNMATGTR
jgi:predicted aconitase